jgi:type VI secretion system protein ImpB
MAGESVGDRVTRVRAPRVHITYEVETGGAMRMKELPFVMGVLGEFTNNPKETDKKLKEREFVEVNLQNFDKVLKDYAPRLQYTVPNKLSTNPDAGEIPVDLSFESLQDFAPDRVAQQVEPLKKLLELRTKLADLRGSLQGNDKLDAILQATLSDQAKMTQLKSELGPSATGEGGGDG